jgi:hypothetical protein
MTRTRCAAALLLLLSGAFSSRARAQQNAEPPAGGMPAPSEATPPPGMPAPTEATPPGADTRPVVPAGELAEQPPAQRAADLSYGVGLRLRWITVPAWMLDLFTKQNVPLSSWGTGIEFFRRKANFDIVVSFNYQNMSPPDGNWLGKGNPAMFDTDYVQFKGLALYSADVSFVWHSMFTEWFGMHYGAGIGVGIVAGEILRTSNSTACTEANAGNVLACNPVGSQPNGSGGITLNPNVLTPGPDDPTNPHRFKDPNVPPVLPVVNLVVGVDFRLPQVRGWEGKIEGGFYNAFFLGAGVGYTF